MKRILNFIAGMLLSVLFVFTGCVSTSIQTDWKDPGFKGTFKKVLIICNVKDPLIRTTLEDDLAAQFAGRGISAVQSNTIFASLRDTNREMVRRKVIEIDADGVLLVRTVDLKVNSFENNEWWNAYYDTPEQPLTAEIYRVQVSLFEAAKGKIVWQALSETYDDDALMKVITNFAMLMVKKLSEQGLI